MPNQPRNRGGYSGNQPQDDVNYGGNKQPKQQDQYGGKQPQGNGNYGGNKPKQPKQQDPYNGNQPKQPQGNGDYGGNKKEEEKEEPKSPNTLQSPKSIELIKSTDSLVEEYEVRNPYVLIIGVSEYTKKNMSKLDGVKVDIPRVYELFNKDFGYKYVFSFLDRLEWENNGEKEVHNEIKKKKYLKKFLKYHSDQIDYLNDKKSANIDAFIFCYSGHGDLDNILLCDGEKYNIQTLHNTFNNEEVDTLRGKPKLFIYDCCRGGDQDEEVKTGNHRGSPEKQTVTVNSDMFYWYSTTSDYKAFETKNGKGGFFFNEFVDLYKEKIQQNKIYKINDIEMKVRQMVVKASGGKQTPETVNRLIQTVYLVPLYLN